MTSPAVQFSRAAQTYERGAGLHRHVAARLIGMMPGPEAGFPGRILEVGCGTGVLTEPVRRRFPDVPLCVLDVAEGMIACVRERWGADPRMEFMTGDVRDFESTCPFDLIVSSSALHWALPLDRTLVKLKGCLSTRGILCMALMVEGTLGELHGLRRRIAPGKTPAGRLPVRSEVVAAIGSAGMEISGLETESIQTHYQSAEDFLGTIHAQGLTGGAVSQAGLPLSRRELSLIRKEYDATYRDGRDGVFATFEILYIRAAAGISG